jgi:hypothetical protein
VSHAHRAFPRSGQIDAAGATVAENSRTFAVRGKTELKYGSACCCEKVHAAAAGASLQLAMGAIPEGISTECLERCSSHFRFDLRCVERRQPLSPDGSRELSLPACVRGARDHASRLPSIITEGWKCGFLSPHSSNTILPFGGFRGRAAVEIMARKAARRCGGSRSGAATRANRLQNHFRPVPE